MIAFFRWLATPKPKIFACRECAKVVVPHADMLCRDCLTNLNDINLLHLKDWESYHHEGPKPGSEESNDQNHRN